MIAQDPESVSARLRTAIELFEVGVAMLRTRLRREHPAMTDAEIDARVKAWLERRRGDEQEDAAFRVVPWPRPRP